VVWSESELLVSGSRVRISNAPPQGYQRIVPLTTLAICCLRSLRQVPASTIGALSHAPETYLFRIVFILSAISCIMEGMT
jgi:hypothetical protein